MGGQGESNSSAPPVPDHSELTNQGAAYRSSILSLTAPSPQPKVQTPSTDFAAELKVHYDTRSSINNLFVLLYSEI